MKHTPTSLEPVQPSHPTSSSEEDFENFKLSSYSHSQNDDSASCSKEKMRQKKTDQDDDEVSIAKHRSLKRKATSEKVKHERLVRRKDNQLTDKSSNGGRKEKMLSSKKVRSLKGKNNVWEKRYEELKQFKARYGHFEVPRRFSENPQFGRWVGHQRTYYKYFKEGKPSSMTEERIQALDELGFAWKSSMFDGVWEKRFEELKQFKARYGHCEVPQRFPESPKLGAWVNTQRTYYRYLMEGKPSWMNEEKIQALNELEFAWKSSVIDRVWEKRFEELKQFKARYGHCEVPRQFQEYPQLGAWVNYQRTYYRYLKEGKTSPMTEERLQALDKLEFAWKATRGEAWDKHYEELKQS